MTLDSNAVRGRFPALSHTDDGRPRYYFDNPAGTQVPDSVVDAMRHCLFHANANIGGEFETSRRAESIVEGAREAMADLLGASSPAEIVFGQNMTTLTLHLSRSIGRTLAAGDEIIVTRMDHDANVQPWLLMARDHDLTVRWLGFDPERCEFDLADLDGLLSDRTRLVCVAGASNLTGTLHDVAGISRRAAAAGAWTFVDAVQSVPHVVTDVRELGCDFLVCSAYKFFGPHQGMLWGRRERLSALEPYKVRPAPDDIPWCFETGTQSHEGIAGVGAAVDYLAWLATQSCEGSVSGTATFTSRRAALGIAMRTVAAYERSLSARLIGGLTSLPGVRVHGVTDAAALDRRVPTISFTHERMHSGELAARLGERGFFVWSGHNYAVEAVRALGLLERGGVLRVGPVHYNLVQEIDDFLNVVEDLLPV